MKIEIPSLPPKEYSLNWRGHWATRYEAGKQFKADVHYCALEARNKMPDFQTIEFAEIKLTFVVKEDRVRDADNWLARMKPGADSLVDAGIIAYDDNKHLKITGIDFEVNPDKAPMTVIEVKLSR